MSKMISATPRSRSTDRRWYVTALITSLSSWRSLSIASPRAFPWRDVPSILTSKDRNSRCSVSWRYRRSESHFTRRDGASSAVTRTSTSPTGRTPSRSATRLNIPSAAFAKSSPAVSPYARIPTSAVCSVSSQRTSLPKVGDYKNYSPGTAVGPWVGGPAKLPIRPHFRALPRPRGGPVLRPPALGPALSPPAPALPAPASRAAAAPPGMPWAPQLALGTLLWMLTWWLTECVPLGIAALLAPPLLLPPGGVDW